MIKLHLVLNSFRQQVSPVPRHKKKGEAGYEKEQIGFSTFHSPFPAFGHGQVWSLSVLALGIRQPEVRGRQLQHGVDEAGVLGVAVVIHLGADKVILPLQPVGIVGGRGWMASCPPAVESQRCLQDVLLRLGAFPYGNHPVHAWDLTHKCEKRHIPVNFHLTFMLLLEEKVKFGQLWGSVV